MSQEFIHDPTGILIFEEPTEVQLRTNGVSSTATIEVLPFSARRDGGVFWAGADTYEVPEEATYTVLEDLPESLDSGR
ncbi:hypothetical protein GCM10027355_35920 [Haloplanus salinarum]|uniref:hypothetical protein n=1 Tax=Haloplanus salinarum TaxID=1912324 RepID=UPI003B432B4C